nr:S24 family peptidase [Rhodobacter sp. NTK016B]
MAERGWTARELSRRAGVSYDVIAKLRTRPGANTSYDNGRKLAEALEIPWAEGAQEHGLEVVKGEPTVSIGVYDIEASAGGGASVMSEAVVGAVALPSWYVSQFTRSSGGDLFVVAVKGDSMEPTLEDGDLVMADKQKRDPRYGGVYVIREDNALLVKRLAPVSQQGAVRVISDNREIYAAVERKADEIDVIGRVVWRGGKL